MRFLLLITLIACVLPSGALAQQRAAPTLLPDPAAPLIALPTSFESRRANSNGRIPASGRVDLVNLEGPGCVRHIWLLPGENVRLVIHVDGADEPQVDMPLQPFFAVMHGVKPYYVDCAAYSVTPNPAPGVPGTPGYNLYLPIPFAKSCRISLLGAEGERATAMVDWQAYEKAAHLTPYRLHAAHRTAKPGPRRGGFMELANISGTGFIAGIVAGYVQRDHSDMVFHTGGMTILIDGETKPHVIRGHNVEDDFGFTWGFNDRQTRWFGCPWHVNRGRLDQDGVFYRFFGPDPIRFDSSVVFRTGSRGDDMETTVYFYRAPGSEAAPLRAPRAWQAVGLFPDADNWDGFAKSRFVESLPAGEWPDELSDGERRLRVHAVDSVRGWVDLQHVFFERHHTATPLTVIGHAAYVRSVIESEENREAVLRLTLDDWAIVWLNGEKVATLRHDQRSESARIPVSLRQGNNELLIKTNNTDRPPNNRHWAIHAAVE